MRTPRPVEIPYLAQVKAHEPLLVPEPLYFLHRLFLHFKKLTEIMVSALPRRIPSKVDRTINIIMLIHGHLDVFLVIFSLMGQVALNGKRYHEI